MGWGRRTGGTRNTQQINMDSDARLMGSNAPPLDAALRVSLRDRADCAFASLRLAPQNATCTICLPSSCSPRAIVNKPFYSCAQLG